jgi:hypothetical protein
MYETTSIITKNGTIIKGTPPGKNNFALFHLSLNTAIIFIPIKCDNAKKNVTTNELVIVNEYGINPIIFAANINKNKKNNVEKY